MTRAADQERREHRHLTADELSATAETLRRGGAQPEQDRAGCQVCRERVEDLLAVLDALPRLERPALPQTVAIRLDAALAREARQRAADAGNGLVPTPARRRRLGMNRRLGWATAGLALVCIALSAAALGGAFNTAGSATATGQPALGSDTTQVPAVPSPVDSALLQSAAASSLSAWALSVLADPSDDVTASGKEGPMVGINSAASVEAAVCAADPAFKGLTPIAEQQGIYDGTSSELIVYGTPDQASSTAYAVAFALPCTRSDYRILSQGSVAYSY